MSAISDGSGEGGREMRSGTFPTLSAVQGGSGAVRESSRVFPRAATVPPTGAGGLGSGCNGDRKAGAEAGQAAVNSVTVKTA